MKYILLLLIFAVTAYADGPIPLRSVGVVADGVTDDAPAIQAAIDAAPSGTVFVLPDNATTLIKSTIQIYGGNKNGISIVGNYKCTFGVVAFLKWGGDTGGYMIDVINASGSYFGGFAMITDDGVHSASRAINMDQSTNSKYPGGSTTQVTVENMEFKNNLANPDLIMVSVAYSSWQNCEMMKIRDCRFYQTYDTYNAANASRGIAISLGNQTGGGGGNNYNQVVERNQFTGFSYDINCYGTKASIRDNEHQGSTVNILAPTGDNFLLVEGNRPENSRQFLKAGTGRYLIQANTIALAGTWNPSYPTIESSDFGGSFTLLNNTWNNDPSNTIIAVKCTAGANTGAKLISKNNHYPNTQHLLGTKSFGTFRYFQTELDDGGSNTMRIQSGRETTGAHAAAPFVNGEIRFTEMSVIPQDNGTQIYVSDGVPSSNPLQGGGNGCLAVRQNGVWVGK